MVGKLIESIVPHNAEIRLLLQVSVPLLQMQVLAQQTLVSRTFLGQVLLQLFGVLNVGLNL